LILKSTNLLVISAKSPEASSEIVLKVISGLLLGVAIRDQRADQEGRHPLPVAWASTR
jgi:hypothetical protein